MTCRDTSGKSHLTNRWDAAIIFLSFFPWTCSVCLFSQNRLWRKSRSRHGNNRCIGTDMNRNFDAQWCGMTSFPLSYTPVSVSAYKILNFENIFIQTHLSTFTNQWTLPQLEIRFVGTQDSQDVKPRTNLFPAWWQERGGPGRWTLSLASHYNTPGCGRKGGEKEETALAMPPNAYCTTQWSTQGTVWTGSPQSSFSNA